MKWVIIMEKETKIICNQRLILKAAQSVWAANKYFVLACSQQQYRKVREHLRPENVKLVKAYEVLSDVYTAFKEVPSTDLPQITNALYHISGYFKKVLPSAARQELDMLIQVNPKEALRILESYTLHYQVDYLLNCSLWPSKRGNCFNQITALLKDKGKTYPPNTLYWNGNSVIFKQKESNDIF